MNTKNEKKGFLEIAGVQTVIASLICIILGLLVGYIVLLCINPSEAWSAMTAILKNFYTSPDLRLLWNISEVPLPKLRLFLCVPCPSYLPIR